MIGLVAAGELQAAGLGAAVIIMGIMQREGGMHRRPRQHDRHHRQRQLGGAAIRRAELQHESWIEPFWAGPRTYAYEWVLLENDKKHKSWLDRKDSPRTGADLAAKFEAWKSSLA